MATLKNYYLKQVQELSSFHIRDILFVCESQSISGKMVIATLNAPYAFTEYLMRFNQDGYTSQDYVSTITYKA